VEPSVAEAISREVQTLFQKCQSAVVRIEATDVHGRLSGSGFFIDPNGTVYTSYSVGGASWDVVVCYGDVKYPARRLVGDPRSGVAILKVEAETPFLMLGQIPRPPAGCPGSRDRISDGAPAHSIRDDRRVRHSLPG
jgi:S1-C subfamily serine protease